MVDPLLQAGFTSFYEGWLVTQQIHLGKLQSLSNSIEESEEECRDLVAEVLSHYQELYLVKNRVGKSDVFLCFFPPWLTSFECSLLWISGFKPSMVFPLLKNSLGGSLSSEQTEELELLKAETKRGERAIGEAMARVQESLAEPPIFHLMKKMGKLVDGEISEFDTAIDDLKKSMAEIIENADALRGSTVRSVVEILSPLQTVKFLAAATEF